MEIETHKDRQSKIFETERDRDRVSSRQMGTNI